MDVGRWGVAFAQRRLLCGSLILAQVLPGAAYSESALRGGVAIRRPGHHGLDGRTPLSAASAPGGSRSAPA